LLFLFCFFSSTVARSDFVASKLVALVTKVDGNGGPDVGTPPGFPFARSGWDMKDVRLAYDYALDELHIGVNCFDVCGDADGDGDESRSSAALTALGGVDLANLANSESFVVALDLDRDGKFDFALGYPAQVNGESERYPCDNALLDTSCFGVYLYDNSPSTQQPGQRLVFKAGSAVAGHSARDNNVKPSLAKPDLEWTVFAFNKLRQAIGVPALDRSGGQVWSLNFLAFSGSFQDDGVGEDQFPNNAPFEVAEFPCVATDACGVCGGDGSSCAGCDGVPNSGRRYDLCGVCGGDDARDCAGVACGSSRNDACGVCNGDGTSCAPPRGECSEEFGNLCKFHPGDVWAGRYRDSPFDKLLAGDAVALTFAPNNYVIETNALGTHWNRFVITDNYVALQEFAAFPERVNRSCLATDVAKYSLKFSADCRAAEIVAIIEPCNRREALYNNMRLTLEKPAAAPTRACALHGGSGIWQAKYRERTNAWTGRHQVGTFTFAVANNAVVESSDSAVYFYTYADASLAGAAQQQLLLTDRGSQDFAQACKAPDAGGRYALTFAGNCSRALLAFPAAKAADACAQRAARLDNLVLMRVPLPSAADNDSPCRIACTARLSSSLEVAECVERCEANAPVVRHGFTQPHAAQPKATPRSHNPVMRKQPNDGHASRPDKEDQHYAKMERPYLNGDESSSSSSS
jgi:hypothetical protein